MPPNDRRMTKNTLTRRDLARQALAGAAGTLLAAASLAAVVPARAQAVDPLPTAPPPLPLSPKPTQNAGPMSSLLTPETTPEKPTTEGTLLTQLVPVAAGYALSETQAKEVAAQLKDYPGGFAKARAYALPDDIGPAFAATAPVHKERVK